MNEFPVGRGFTQPTWPAPVRPGMQPTPNGRVVYPPIDPAAQAQQNGLNKATYEALRQVILDVVEAPWHKAPFRAQPLLIENRWVVGPATTANAAALAAATALALASAPYSGGLTLTTQTTTGSFTAGLTYQIPLGYRAVIQGIGLGAPGANKDALRWRVVNGGVPLGLGAQGGGLWPRGSADDLMAVNLISGLANDTFTIEVRNLDINSGYLVEARIAGYMFPVAQNDDSQRSLINNGGPDTNGMWFGPNGPRV